MKCECSTKTVRRYRHWVTIQSFTGTADAYGHIDLTDSSNWSTFGKVKANFISRGGREGRIFDQVQAEATHIAETPSTTFSRTINESMRVFFNSRYYNITLVDDVNQEREVLQLYLTEVK